MCGPGDTRTCVGPGACEGGQSCLDDGSGYGACECDATSMQDAGPADASGASGGGSGGDGDAGGAGGSGDAGGSGGIGGAAGFGPAAGSGGSSGASGSGGGGAGGSGGAASSCTSDTLDSDITVTTGKGNVLVLFDQSGSMGEAWGSGPTKLAAANAALVAAVTPLQNTLTLGAIFFPTGSCVPAFPPPQGGAVEPIDGPNQLSFQSGSSFLTAWEARFVNPAVVGTGTPLQEAMDRADIAINDALDNGTISGPLVVIVFTDGEPNCFNDSTITGIPVNTEVNRAFTWLNDHNIETYVVGLPGGQGVQILQDIAYYGGTETYLLPDDPSVLENQLRTVVEQTMTQTVDTCSIALSPAADPTSALHVVVVEGGDTYEVPRDLGGGAGWSVSGDGTQVQLLGTFCDRAQAGSYDSITFELGCVEWPTLQL